MRLTHRAPDAEDSAPILSLSLFLSKDASDFGRSTSLQSVYSIDPTTQKFVK
jgi:hypothetical protein